MRRFAAVLSLLAVFTFLAVPAFAAEPAAVETPSDAVATPTEEAPVEAPEVSDEEVEELLRSLDATAGAENKYACPGYLECTFDRDCEIFWQLECPAPFEPECDNPSGTACNGVCFCPC
jgi:hypothetical protein